jgi:predicted acylesterase/phospholipase RssA
MPGTKNKKLGLALSGGGFRASFFHIGVLASLAESDVLKDVEVLSCVSGGSIIGAYYYLYIKRLLETKTDNQIEQEDYINIVKEIEVEFLKSVQTNIRVQAFSSLKSNWRMVWGDKYSRSDRMADLYDRYFYNRFLFDDDKNNNNRLSMKELLINPFKEEVGADIREFNETRKNKVPMLILNATTLNTGRNWQFTATDMGERDKISKEKNTMEINLFNKNVLFKAFPYTREGIKNADSKYLEFPLGIAVAASACVPGLFTPLALTELYGDIVPLLVDGGVYDNQGISPIIYEGCSHVIVSDASGQLDFMENLRNDPVGVTKRTNSVLLNRIRNQGLEFADYIQRNRDDKIDNEILLHLREGLKPEIIEPFEKFEGNVDSGPDKTYYGINKKVQLLLSGLRTDLDSFTEAEAFALMYSGYCMISRRLTKEFVPDTNKKLVHEWNFKRIKEFCEDKEDEKFSDILNAGRKVFFKAFDVSAFLFLLEIFAFIIPLVVLSVPFLFFHFFEPEYFISFSVFTLVIIIIAVVSNMIKFVNVVKRNILFKGVSLIHTFLIVVSGWIVSNLYLKLINKKFNKWGSLDSLFNKK